MIIQRVNSHSTSAAAESWQKKKSPVSTLVQDPLSPVWCFNWDLGRFGLNLFSAVTRHFAKPNRNLWKTVFPSPPVVALHLAGDSGEKLA